MAEQEGNFGTPEEQLQVLNEAIYKILVGGQSYKIGTRSLTRADLSALIAERNRLETQMDGTVQIAAYYGRFCGAKRPQCEAERPGFLLI